MQEIAIQAIQIIVKLPLLDQSQAVQVKFRLKTNGMVVCQSASDVT